MKKAPSVTIIIPVLNEAGNLTPLMEEIKSVMAELGVEWETIVVDDGSTDDTLAELRRLDADHPELRFMSFERNFGQTAALKCALDAARFEVVVTMDGDMQIDPADIPKLVAAYQDGLDMVLGKRINRHDSRVKRLASRAGNRIRNAFTKDGVEDIGCSLRLMNTEMARKLPWFRGIHRFFPTLMMMLGGKVGVVPVNHRARLHGQTKYHVFDRAREGAYDLLAVSWMLKRSIEGYRVKESDSKAAKKP